VANISVPAAAYSALTSMVDGDTLSVSVYRNASSATDTYTTDLDVLGFLVVFTLDTTVPVAGHIVLKQIWSEE